ncbi:MAG: hypothetical protein ABI472_23085 [Ginsengibacter sp.]
MAISNNPCVAEVNQLLLLSSSVIYKTTIVQFNVFQMPVHKALSLGDIDQLEFFQTVSESNIKEDQGGSVLETNYSALLAGLGGSKKYSTSEGSRESQSSIKTRTLSSKIVAIKILMQSKIPLIVDDFHYISRDLQASIIRALK